MNAKKVKLLRKMLRNASVNLRDAKYYGGEARITKDPFLGLTAIVPQKRLDHECGRGIYVAAKAMAVTQ